MKRNLLAIYEFAEGKYTGSIPDLPGCVTRANSLKAMQTKMHKVFYAHAKLMIAKGQEIPSMVTTTIHFPKPVKESDTQHWVVEKLEIEVPA